MDPEHWREIGRILTAVLEHPAHERGHALQELCGGDARFAAEVDVYLDAHGRSSGILDSPVPVDLQAEPAPAKGEHIGSYEVVGEVGRGGMGEVYLAVRADEAYERQVAIKLVKRGMDSREIVRRFHHERRILASLDHPGIARLLDGGSITDGRPYFVMDYIEGQPIDEYCRAGHLSVRSRLELFRKVCAAVEHAHRQLLVHRDLKPANILVEAAGEPKLLDFGIAKLLTGEPGWAETRTEVRPMTLEYSSPEQLRGEVITAAVDIHALGLLLYELLVGRHPYRAENSTPAALRRAICEDEPEPPSAAASGDAAKRLRRRLKGDLDAIVLVALRKDPRERYASVAALDDDVRRHLEGEPVRARRGTAWYRTSKFVRRSWRPLTVAAGFLVLVAVFLASTLRQGEEIARRAETAQRTADFMVELFAIADPGEARGEAVTAREILDRGVQRIEEELADEPEIRTELTHTMGRVYGSLGLYEPAKDLLRTALTAKRAVYGDEHPALLETLRSAAENHRNLGQYDDAERLAREALGLARSVYGAKHSEVGAAMDKLAAILWTRGDLAAAEAFCRESLALKRELGDRSTLGYALNVLGAVLLAQGDFKAAEESFGEALIHSRREYGSDHPVIMSGLNNLAMALTEQGRGEEAEPLLREVIATGRRILGESHPDLATNLTNLSMLLHRLERDDEAEPVARDALRIYRRSLGGNHPAVTIALNNLALIVQARGEIDEASGLYLEAETLRRQILGDEDLEVAVPLANRAILLVGRGADATAEPLLREALAIYAKTLPEVHWRRASAESALGECLTGLGRYREAETLLLESLPVLEEQRGPESAHARGALRRLAELYEALGQPEIARPYRQRLASF